MKPTLATPEFLDFFSLVWMGVEHADKKHGDWSDESIPQCVTFVSGELEEVFEACHRSDFDGEHGIKAESVQVAVTAFKLWRRCHA